MQIMHELQDLGAGVTVKIARRLIGQQDRRIDGKRPRDGNTLTLASGEFVGQVIQTDPSFTRVSNSRARSSIFLAGPAAQVQRDRDIFQTRQGRQQVEELKNESDFVAP